MMVRWVLECTNSKRLQCFLVLITAFKVLITKFNQHSSLKVKWVEFNSQICCRRFLCKRVCSFFCWTAWNATDLFVDKRRQAETWMVPLVGAVFRGNRDNRAIVPRYFQKHV